MIHVARLACVCRRWIALLVLAATAVAAPLMAESADVTDTLTRVGTYIQSYYGRAQSVMVQEEVLIQLLHSDLSSDGFPRRVVNELRIEWDPSNDDERVRVVRRQLSASGPRLFEDKQETCSDPPPVTLEPLAFLLPDKQSAQQFKLAKVGRVSGRQAVAIEYRDREHADPSFELDGDCPKMSMGDQWVGQFWVDPLTGEVLRNETRLARQIFLRVPREARRRKDLHLPSEITYERSDFSTSYRRVAFKDPDESLLLPSEMQRVSVYRLDDRLNRIRVTHRFSNYRRFVTAGRLVVE